MGVVFVELVFEWFLVKYEFGLELCDVVGDL